MQWKSVVKRMEILKVSSKSNPSMVAGALAGTIRSEGEAELQAIGAGAVNQAVKAVAIASGFFNETDIKLVCYPGFAEIEIEGESKTAIRLVIQTLPRT